MTKSSNYSRHTAGGIPPEIWQREKFGQLILVRIIEIVATRCQILRLKCTKFDFNWGSTADPAGGAYSTPPDPLAAFKGAYFMGREGREREGREMDGRFPRLF